MLPATAAPGMPPEVLAALQRARVPAEALSVVVQEAGTGKTVLLQQADRSVNPASLAKLTTTYAALDLLGPAWTWGTGVWMQGPVRSGVLEGDLSIKGSGDPRLVLERLWMLFRRVQQYGVEEIRGDIVLDSSAFAPDESDPGDFDGDASRTYNVRPDALMLNFKSTLHTFVPDAEIHVARVLFDTDVTSVHKGHTVPLAPGPCTNWRQRLKPAASEDGGYRFEGVYPAACGELAWPLADPDPATFNSRLVTALWRNMGGRLGGAVHAGDAPAGVAPTFEFRSEPLAEVVRDINKFSNNVMAQQLFLTLASQLEPGIAATPDGARRVLRRWVTERIGDAPSGLVIDNGSGLSRDGRVTARWMAHLLQHAWSSTVMPELMSSLPVSGVDGTLRRSRATAGRAHLKTGSLRDVSGVAGYVLSDSGRRYVLVAIVNHANAPQARPALDAMVQWVLRDAPAR